MAGASDQRQVSADNSNQANRELLAELQRLRSRVAQLEAVVADPPSEPMATSDTLGKSLGDSPNTTTSLKTIVNSVPVFSFTVDPSGVITFGEGKSPKLLDVKSTDLVGKAVGDVFGGPSVVDRYLRPALGGASVSGPIEIDGRVLDLWLAPVRDVQGNVVSAAGIVIDATRRSRVEEELRSEQRLMQQMLRLHERDRQLIAYEVHDGLVQDATGAMMLLEALLQTGELSTEVRERMRQATELVRKSVSQARDLIRGLRPPILDELGVVPAIEYLIEETGSDGPPIELVAEVRFDRLEPLLETTIYRIVQEAITNAARHSHSDRVKVCLTQVDERIHVQIQDWGVGFDPGSVNENRFGLQGIRERARLLRGRAVIDSAPGKGARIFVDLPVACALHEVASANSWSIE